ncbi:MAG: helix-turn-helix domain-containing protein [Desulfacinum sp.]|jgi:excisionase family DNA binding protein|nr:helix-turn-helix domain-containing protein [Desulfacinum infernum]MBC7358363.1 helix-turn-helix domain-containing protein [Desulfacinum sp.]
MKASERWVGVDDVPARLGVAKDSVYRWIGEGGLPAHRVGRFFRFKLSKIDEWVRQDNEPENTSNSFQSRPSSKAQTNRSAPKKRSRKRGGNE